MDILKIKKPGIILFCLSFSFSIAWGQSEFKVGDELPPVVFDQMVNYPSKKVNVNMLSSNKLVILDYWSKGCYPCMADFPRLDSLQQEFANEIQILPWSADILTDVETIFTNIITGRRTFILPSAAEAKLSTSAENYGSKLWIYKNEVVAITGKGMVNRNSIKAALQGDYPIDKDMIAMEKTIAEVGDFSHKKLTKNILYEGNEEQFEVLITRGIPGYQSTRVTDTEDFAQFYGMRYINYSLSDLCYVGFDANYKAIIDLKNPDHFRPKRSHYNASNTYCLEIISKDFGGYDVNAVYRAAKEAIGKSLERAFGITATRAVRKVKGYVVKAIPGEEKFYAQAWDGQEVSFGSYHINYSAVPMDRFLKQVWYGLIARDNTEIIGHIFNETSYEGNVSLNITAATNNFDEMKKALAEYGLDLTIGKREKEVWVIKEIE